MAITATMILALGLKPLRRPPSVLIANTAPVAFGAIAIPIATAGTWHGPGSRAHRRGGGTRPRSSRLCSVLPADDRRRRRSSRPGPPRWWWAAASPWPSGGAPPTSPTSSRTWWPRLVGLAAIVVLDALLAARRAARRCARTWTPARECGRLTPARAWMARAALRARGGGLRDRQALDRGSASPEGPRLHLT
ncbi:L-lactate permease [Kocuria rhizophila]|nr:L-lactate permease [Kocuria rhizophila]